MEREHVEHVSLHSEDETILSDSDHTSHIGLASHHLKPIRAISHIRG